MNDYDKQSLRLKRSLFKRLIMHLKIASIRRQSYLISKRLLDIVVSLFVLLTTWPIMLCIAIYVKKHSSAMPIFRQTRVAMDRRIGNNGHAYYLCPKTKKMVKDRRIRIETLGSTVNERRKFRSAEKFYFCQKAGTRKNDRRDGNFVGRPFVFYKFRTMYPDAKERFPHLYSYQYTEDDIKSIKFKLEDDPRVPVWASWLRKSSLDELPNFFNVLLGDMSLVGPRPDIPEMVKYYSDDQKMKLAVKPGITGLAQIKGRGHLSFQDTLKYDIEYVKRQTFLFDMKMILQTIVISLTQKGAY